MGKIPDRWLKYKPIGQQIKGTRFIAFKVPLSTSINEQVEDNKTRLDILQVLEMIPNLGMVIDLTNTNRYYHPEIFEENGVKHVKLMIPGHEIPKQEHREMFSKHVKDFLGNEDNAGKLIGVHCTHGVNRTGFLICYHMVTFMNFSPHDAVKRKLIGVHCTHGVNRTGFLICYHLVTCMNFSPHDAVKRIEEARGHKIEHKNYRNFIFRLRPIVNRNNLDNRTMNGGYEDNRERVIRGPASSYGNRTRSPDYPRLSPDQRRRSPDNGRKSPDNWRRPLDNRRKSPDNWRQSLDNKRKSPDNWRRSPARARLASSYGNRTRSPDYRRLSPHQRRRSPDNGRKSPDNWRRPLDNRRKSPDNWRQSLDNKRKSPDNWRRSPARARQFPAYGRQSPSTYSHPDNNISGNNTCTRYQRPEDSAPKSHNFRGRGRFVGKRKSNNRDQKRNRSPQMPSSNDYRIGGGGNYSSSRPDPLPSSNFLPTFSVTNDLNKRTNRYDNRQDLGPKLV